MREPLDDFKPGEEVKSSLGWRSDDTIPSGARVEATDGLLGVVRGRANGYLDVETAQGPLQVPERLVRETRGDIVMLSLPAADVVGQSGPPMRPSN